LSIGDIEKIKTTRRDASTDEEDSTAKVLGLLEL
jgi:hypothetical protein